MRLPFCRLVSAQVPGPAMPATISAAHNLLISRYSWLARWLLAQIVGLQSRVQLHGFDEYIRVFVPVLNNGQVLGKFDAVYVFESLIGFINGGRGTVHARGIVFHLRRHASLL